MTRPDIPVLRGGDLILRAPHPDDDEAFAELLNDPVNADQTEMRHPCTPQVARELIEATIAGWGTTHPYRFAIESPYGAGATRYAGTASLISGGAAAADIGFCAHPASRGHGVAKAATRLLVDWGFESLSIPAIRWRAHAGNYASWRVAWHLGFGFDSMLTAAIDHRGEARDAWVATLKRDDERKPTTSWMTPTRMQVEDLAIRPLEPSDELRYLETLSDPESHRWLGNIPSLPQTSDGFRNRMRQQLLTASLGQVLNWTVANRRTDEYLASVTLFDFQSLNYKSAEVGYRTHPSARGRGVLTRALPAVLAYAFTPEGAGGLGLDRISLAAGDGNLGSLGVARSCGFTETGRDRQCYDLADGSVVDLIRFDLLRSEFER